MDTNDNKQIVNDVCRTLLEECAREMGLTLDVIAKSSHRKALRDVVEQAARQKLATELARVLPIPSSEFLQAQANTANMQNRY